MQEPSPYSQIDLEIEITESIKGYMEERLKMYYRDQHYDDFIFTLKEIHYCNDLLHTLNIEKKLAIELHKGDLKKMTTQMTTEILNPPLMNIDEFLKLDTVEQRNTLLYYRNTYTNKEILKGMSISSVKYYNLVKDFNLPKAPRVDSGVPRKTYNKKPVKKKKEKAPDAATSEKNIPIIQEMLEDKTYVPYQPPVHDSL